ncbi:MAG: hypothetical protein CMB31_03700 [Euryarchaeota archaeon]|nr:hypothetical protein [Euryarchaeota archaeon]
MESPTNLRSPLKQGTERSDGFWVDPEGKVLNVSASEIERYVYCPMSWRMENEGISAKGKEVDLGIEEHQRMHQMVVEKIEAQNAFTRNIVIWSWWFAVVLTLAADTVAFYFVQDGLIDSELASMIGKYLVLLALVWLILAIVLLILPWRKWFGWNEKLVTDSDDFSQIENDLQPLITPLKLGEKGWLTFGRLEALILFSAIALSLHGIALTFAQNRSLATFALLVLALIWTLLATTRLQAALSANQRIKEKNKEGGLEELGEIQYSDGGDSILLEDLETGLRGRPDQITRIGNDLIPVELKTGKIPIKPHKSHRFQILAYLHLIESMTGSPPPFGFLRYGTESVFSIDWNAKEKANLFSVIKEIQQVTVQGGAKRDHNRLGKCESCSRKEGCPDRLEFIPNQ